ncbi:hypothetical protein Zmor_014218 [Zophobas morio]|uniref:Uncharacterized protein n=1 Tax=Zophobas morio TaxID=2755281 RepID=A0AA38IFL2_9CUCU|nr:hypothetical protein Zmor_014218 [Zophobas morio]
MLFSAPVNYSACDFGLYWFNWYDYAHIGMWPSSVQVMVAFFCCIILCISANSNPLSTKIHRTSGLE